MVLKLKSDAESGNDGKKGHLLLLSSVIVFNIIVPVYQIGIKAVVHIINGQIPDRIQTLKLFPVGKRKIHVFEKNHITVNQNDLCELCHEH